jgi:hypothetical protein
MHLSIAAHVGEDLANRSVLRGSQTVWQLLFESARELATVTKSNSSASRTSKSVSAAVKEMDE